MKGSENRVLTTHCGSLPRTDRLQPLMAAFARGEKPDQEELSEAVSESTKEVILRQLEVGIDVGNSGEQARISFSSYVTQRMTGFGSHGQRMNARDLVEHGLSQPGMANPSAVNLRAPPKCVAPVHYECLDAALNECDEFTRIIGDSNRAFEEAFMTAASPGVIAMTMQNDHYSNYGNYLFSVAEEMRKEYELIVSKGFVLQLDCPDLAMERHISYQDKSLASFQDRVALNIKAINKSLRNIPPERVRLHVCWGNYEGPHHHDVPLEDILPYLYDANVGALSLEMANPRHAHEYRVFEKFPLPDSMMLVVGVIDTKTKYVEHPQVVADRILRVAQILGGKSRVIAGTDCGFDTSAGAGRVDRGLVWAKLKSLSEGAQIATCSSS
ncbi:cobalamin-independent methionine synthase II family protein [SAR202 cluster bacterium AD-804-J14_MRT_500m]|nr:cobalamin-independent methionine synthase II family protein [SAR202 cluster bacterium AD-804-J14_MRT_500m]